MVISSRGLDGIMEVHSASLLAFTNNNRDSGSNAGPPHSAPPLNCGSTTDAFNPGGIKISPVTIVFSFSSTNSRAFGFKSVTSFVVNRCTAYAGGFTGNGCVGQLTSPGISDF